MRIDHPARDQLCQLQGLWQEAFGDEQAYLDLFFSAAFSPDRCLCAYQDGKLAGALYWLDCRLDGRPVAYLYAVATAAAFRRQGICRALMEHAQQRLKDLGYAGAVLVPGDDVLRKMYAGMGYQNATTIRQVKTMAGREATALSRIGGAQYARLRQRLLPPGSILQEGEGLSLLEATAALYAGNGFVLAGTEKDESFYGIEFLGEEAALPGILAALGKAAGTFCMPGGEIPYAMWKPLLETAQPQYFAFAFE